MGHHPQGGGLRVAPPEQEHVAVLGDVGVEVGGGHLTHRLAPPHVLGPPVPPLPGVHVAHLEGVPPHEGQQPVGTAVAGGHPLALAVHVALAQHRLRTVGLLHPLELIGTDLGGLVPGDAHILALAPVLGVSLPLGVPVHPLEGVLHPVGGVHPALVPQPQGGDGHPVRGGEGLAPGLDLPGIAVDVGIRLVVGIGSDAGDTVLVGVHQAGPPALRTHQAVTDQGLGLWLKLVGHAAPPCANTG